jgi:hypothetical protein
MSNSWCATLNPSGAKPILKLPNPLQNSSNPTTEDNYNLHTQIVVVKTKKKHGEMGCDKKNVKKEKGEKGEKLGNGGIVV